MIGWIIAIIVIILIICLIWWMYSTHKYIIFVQSSPGEGGESFLKIREGKEIIGKDLILKSHVGTGLNIVFIDNKANKTYWNYDADKPINEQEINKMLQAIKAVKIPKNTKITVGFVHNDAQLAGVKKIAAALKAKFGLDFEDIKFRTPAINIVASGVNDKALGKYKNEFTF